MGMVEVEVTGVKVMSCERVEAAFEPYFLGKFDCIKVYDCFADSHVVAVCSSKEMGIEEVSDVMGARGMVYSISFCTSVMWVG